MPDVGTNVWVANEREWMPRGSGPACGFGIAIGVGGSSGLGSLGGLGEGGEAERVRMVGAWVGVVGVNRIIIACEQGKRGIGLLGMRALWHYLWATAEPSTHLAKSNGITSPKVGEPPRSSWGGQAVTRHLPQLRRPPVEVIRGLHWSAGRHAQRVAEEMRSAYHDHPLLTSRSDGSGHSVRVKSYAWEGGGSGQFRRIG